MMRSVQGYFWVDDTLEDGYLRVTDERHPRIFMTMPTFRALFKTRGALLRLGQALRAVPGVHLLPRSIIEPEAAADLRQGLSYVTPEASDVCIYPPCGLAAETVHEDGFPLCSTHAGLMSDWDDLLSV